MKLHHLNTKAKQKIKVEECHRARRAPIEATDLYFEPVTKARLMEPPRPLWGKVK